MDKFDYLQAALKDPWVRAYLKTIQHNEGTDRGGRGYATYFRYYDNSETPDETLRSYHLHWMPIGNGKFSSASGAYQIINKTYRGLQDIFTRTGVFQRMGVRPDSWSPEVQDMMAVELLNENGILRRLLAHDPGVLTAGNKTWASFGVKSPQSTAAAFNHYLQQEGQPPVTVKINGQDFNGAGLSYAGGTAPAPAGSMGELRGTPDMSARPDIQQVLGLKVGDINWGDADSTNMNYFGGYRSQASLDRLARRSKANTLAESGVNTPYNRQTRPVTQPVPMGLSNLVLSPETDISDSKKGINNRAFMINEATNPPEGVTYGASFTGSGIRPTATKWGADGSAHNYTLVRDSEYAPDSGEAPAGVSGQSPAAGTADASPESEFDVLPMDEYLDNLRLPSDDVGRLGTRVDPRIKNIVENVSVDKTNL
jgi:muramidase (phage lysozyme)